MSKKLKFVSALGIALLAIAAVVFTFFIYRLMIATVLWTLFAITTLVVARRVIDWQVLLVKLKALLVKRSFWYAVVKVVLAVLLVLLVVYLVKGCDSKSNKKCTANPVTTSADTATPDTSAPAETSEETNGNVINNSGIIINVEGDGNVIKDIMGVVGDSNKVDNAHLENSNDNSFVDNDVTGDNNKIDNSKKEESTTAPETTAKKDDVTTQAPDTDAKKDDTTKAPDTDAKKDEPKEDLSITTTTTQVLVGTNFEVIITSTGAPIKSYGEELFSVTKVSDYEWRLTVSDDAEATGDATFYLNNGEYSVNVRKVNPITDPRA